MQHNLGSDTLTRIGDGIRDLFVVNTKKLFLDDRLEQEFPNFQALGPY